MIGAPEGFRYYRDDLPSSEAPIEAQRPRFDSIFDTLRGAGIRRSNLYLAWDFTVASDENIAGRMLAMRNDAFGQLGDTTMADLTVQGSSPSFAVTDVQDFTEAQDPEVAREVIGTYEVPCYLAPTARRAAASPSGPTASRPATATTRRSSTASSPGWRSTGPTR